MNLNKKYLTGGMKVGAYFAGYPTTIMSTIILVSLTYYYTDIIGLNVAIVTSIMFISQFIDCFTDAVGGALIDRMNHPKGKSRVWIFRMAIPYLITTFLLYVIPDGSDTVKYVYVFLIYNIANAIVFTMATIAAFTITSTMTKNQEERAQIGVLRQLGASSIELVITLSCFPLTTALGGGKTAWLIVIGGMSLIAMISMFICYALIKELPPKELGQDESEKIPIMKAFMVTLKNPYWWVVLLAWGSVTVCMTISGTVAAYFTTYIMNDVNLASYSLAMEKAFILVSLIVIVPFMMKRMEKRWILFIGALSAAFGHLIVLIDLQNPTIMLLAFAIRGLGSGLGFGMFSAMIADTVEYGHWKSGIRAEAIGYSSSTLGIKVFSGFAMGAVGWILGAAGYDGMAEVQVASANAAITNMYVWGPFIFFALIAVFAAMFKVEKYMPTILKDIEDGNVGEKRSKLDI